MAKLPIKSWQQRIYVASKLGVARDAYGNQIVSYGFPAPFNLNVQPLSDDARIAMFGANSKKMYKAVITDRNIAINEFDVAYLEGVTYHGESANGANANFIVRRVMRQNIACVLFFESIKG
jgi:hypothetical protein